LERFSSEIAASLRLMAIGERCGVLGWVLEDGGLVVDVDDDFA